MIYKEAMKLKQGDKVVQKCHGYIMTVQSIEEYNQWTGKNYIIINCVTEDGNKMREKHKDVNLYR